MEYIEVCGIKIDKSPESEYWEELGAVESPYGMMGYIIVDGMICAIYSSQRNIISEVHYLAQYFDTPIVVIETVA